MTRLATLFAVALLALVSLAAAQRTAQPRAASTQILGATGNAWSAAAVGVGGTSTALDLSVTRDCSAFGNTSAASTITVQLSQDNATFRSSGINTGAVTGDFGINFTTGARYVRLISSAAATITATVACKG